MAGNRGSMQAEAKRVCLGCETLIDDGETKCPCCGALFTEIPGRDPDESIQPPMDVEPMDADGPDVDEPADEPQPEPGRARLGMAGIVISALGAVGVLAGVFLDPLRSLAEPVHPAAIEIGATQLAGILAAAIVTAIGVILAFSWRKNEAVASRHR